MTCVVKAILTYHTHRKGVSRDLSHLIIRVKKLSTYTAKAPEQAENKYFIPKTSLNKVGVLQCASKYSLTEVSSGNHKTNFTAALHQLITHSS